MAHTILLSHLSLEHLVSFPCSIVQLIVLFFYILLNFQVQQNHSGCISFWISKRQAISTDTSFEIKMMVKIYAIEIIFRSHEPFQSYQLTGLAEPALLAELAGPVSW